MPQTQVDEYLALLRESQLLTSEQLAAVARRTQTATAGLTVEQLSAELVRDGLLTSWQRDQLARGQTDFVLQHYRLLEPAGRGGMGYVFRARDERNGQLVAVKVMARRLTGDRTLVNRFRREIRASRQLHSPHIIRTLDAGRVGQTDFMVMEYVNGEQLDRLIRRIGVLPVPLACDIIRQAAVGLQHAHEKQMVHRDIKPANLIIHWEADGRGTVKLMDLGLVRLGEEDEEQRAVTRAGQVMGTPDYMSPEQGWDTARVDIRGDIYSLGCTLFRLISGRIPFMGDNPLQVLMARCYKDAPSVRSLRAEIPEALDAVVQRMTRRDPEERYQTPAEVVHALTPFCEPLRRASLQMAAAQAEAALEAEVAEDLAEEQQARSQEAGYQQFLKEQGEPTSAELLSRAAAAEPASATVEQVTGLPLIDHRAGRAGSADQRQRRRRQRPALGVLIGGAAAGLAVGLAGLTWWLRPPATPGAGQSTVPRQQELATGGTGGTGGDFASGSTGPAVTDDGTVGGPHGGTVSGTAGPPPDMAATIAPPDVQEAQPGTLLTFRPVVRILRPAVSGRLYFALREGAPAAVQMDPETGEIVWQVSPVQTPAEYEIPFCLKHEHNARQRDVAAAVLRVRVVSRMQAPVAGPPEPLQFAFPELPDQRVVAGQLLDLSLTTLLPEALQQQVRLKLAGPVPPGVSIQQLEQRLTWKIPESAVGRHVIQLAAESLRPDRPFSVDSRTTGSLVLDVTAARPVSLAPDAAAVAAAEAEIREVFRRELAQARTPAARLELAALLLERSLPATAGAADFAMLNVATEQAEKARAPDVLLEINHLRSERYQLDELPAATGIAAEMRRAGLSALQVDLTAEHCVRLAAAAARQQRWAETVQLLSPVEQLLRGQSGLSQQLLEDVQRAQQLAKDLEAGSTAAAAASVASEIRTEELQRLLGRWQFLQLFEQLDTVVYLQSSNTENPPADQGRSLWRHHEECLLLETESRNGLLGFVDTARDCGRYLLRLQLLPGCNSAGLIFGAGRSTELSAFVLTLDGTAPGRIQRLPGGTTITDGSSAGSAVTSGLRQVDILVDGTSVTARINGTTVASTVLKDLAPGRIGLVVPLLRADGGPQLKVRRARLLLLPDAAD